ncbi:hypothetical protein SBRCBS47491_008240 [Sporothrix bragantina]|uniref:Uncharacterized protein n=1 Tax=Sporothrix bragantina TaxID=671064 RepID=A0ABP0CLT4_9PEZI
MQFSAVLTLLASAGIAAASACRLSQPSSSSVSSFSSASPSASPICVIDTTVNYMGASTNIVANPNYWNFADDTTNAASHEITTCDSGPTNNCVIYTGTNPLSGYMITFRYTANTVPGAKYVFAVDVSQDTNLATQIIFYAGNTDGQNYLHLNTEGEVVYWTLPVTAAYSVTDFHIVAQPVDPMNYVTFNNFAVYKMSC